jgi:hypothetical protein
MIELSLRSGIYLKLQGVPKMKAITLEVSTIANLAFRVAPKAC